MFPHRSQAVGTSTGRDGHDVRRVVTRPTVVIVAPVEDAIVDQQREEWRRHILRVHALDDVIAPDLDIDKVPQLAIERVKYFFERLEVSRISGRDADLFLGARVE